MKLFSLNSLIDDILLIIRNNNISESEDLSRAQIELWIHQYRAKLIKQSVDKGYEIPEQCYQVISPIVLRKEAVNNVDSINLNDSVPSWLFFYVSTDIPKPIQFHTFDGIVSVTDLYDDTIQRMSKTRRHYHWFRKYTSQEYTYYYIPNKIYVQGKDGIRYIKVTGVFEDPTEAGLNADDSYPVAADMIPTIKQMIFDSEIKVMLNRPSDDINDASHSNIKPTING